jgi:hypothetical protein
MYLVAQKVRGPAGEGVNAFLYLHGAEIWKGWPPFLPEERPGTLHYSSVSLKEGGNEVRSYLDVLTPDVTSPQLLRASFDRLLLQHPNSIMPAGVLVPPCWFRFNMDLSLSPFTGRELKVLFEYVYQLRVQAFGM